MKAIDKDFWREIQRTRSRFASILILVALAVTFLSGLKATAPDMKGTCDVYLDQQNFMDIQVLSTLGLTEDDVAALLAQPGVSGGEGAYVIDAFAHTPALDIVAKVYSLPRSLNRLTLDDGRMPQAADECVADRNLLESLNLRLGDRVTLLCEGDSADALAVDAFTVVGAVTSPLYISVERGSSTLGTGRVAAYVYVPESAFAMEFYTAAYLTVDGAQEETAFSPEYDALVSAVTDGLEPLGEERAALRRQTLVDDANDRLSDAQKELDEAKADAEAELADAWATLSDARTELDDGWAEVADARRTLDEETADAQRKLEDGKAELADALTDLNSAEADYAQGVRDYEDGLGDYEDALAEYRDGQAKYEEGKQEYEEGKAELESARTKLQRGETKLRQARQELETQQARLDTLADTLRGLVNTALSGGTDAPYATNRALLDAMEDPTSGTAVCAGVDGALDGARGALEGQEAELAGQQAQLEQLIAGLEQAIADAEEGADVSGEEAQLEQLRPQLSAVEQGLAQVRAQRTQLEELSAQTLAQGDIQLRQGWAQYRRSSAELDDGWAEFDQGREELRQAKEELADALAQLDDAKRQLEDGRLELEDAAAALADARTELDDGWQDYRDGLQTAADGETELADKVADAQREIGDAVADLRQGERDYEDGLGEYRDGKAEADGAIGDAERTLADARRKVADIGSCEWYVLSRDSNPGYLGFGQDADRMGNLASLFPVLFFLVAALVCLTTMTRMVEEQRTQIGCLKALGYTRWSISRKYLGYGLLPSLLGGVLGLALGYTLFPKMIFTAYQIMYQLPDIRLAQYPAITLGSLAAAAACTTVSSLASCLAALADVPANLMRPRSPKPGRRVVLEYIRPLWRRMSFNRKVTARNLFRYQKRFWMTVIGIGGCTALIIAGFGLRSSLLVTMDRQFGQLYRYTAQVALASNVLDSERETLDRAVADDARITASLPCRLSAATAESDRYSTSVYVEAADPERIAAFVDLHDDRTGEPLRIPDDGVLIDRKLAELLAVDVGDSFTLDSDGRCSVTVAGIYEHYLAHFVYLSPAGYQRTLGTAYRDNAYLLTLADDSPETCDAVFSDLMNLNGVASATRMLDTRDTYQHSMERIDFVVVIVILSAAALALVVLYNLSNINITERKRELATIKVLGFYDREVSAYVNRENVILTAVGIALGMGAGRWLHAWLVRSVEIDLMMFGRQTAPSAFLWAAGLTAAFSAAVNLLGYRKMRRIDMVESLKSAE